MVDSENRPGDNPPTPPEGDNTPQVPERRPTHVKVSATDNLTPVVDFFAPGTKFNQRDLVLWLLAAAVAVVLWLSPPSPTFKVIGLLVLFGFLVLPIWHSPWIEKHIGRRIVALALLAVAVFVFGRYVLNAPSGPSAPPPDLHTGDETIHSNRGAKTTAVYVNAQLINDGDDARFAAYESYTMEPSSFATPPDQETIDQMRAWVRRNAAAKFGGSIYSIPKHASRVVLITGPVLRNDQVKWFTSGAYTFYFDALLIADNAGGQKPIDICGYSPGNGSIYECTIGRTSQTP